MHLIKDPDDIQKDIDEGQPTFWDYSFSEVGIYDIPAMLAYIKEKTGFEKITLIGHSQGTSATFAGLIK